MGQDKWADLPIDILSHILFRLSSFDDIVVLGAVCKSWQLAILALHKPPLPPKFPWLMLAQEDDKRGLKRKEEAIQTRGFYSLLDHKTYKFNLPEAVGRKCIGTSFGWLLTLGVDLKMNLLHPMSKIQVRLPPQPAFKTQYEFEEDPEHLRDIFVRKAVLSANPWKFEAQQYDPYCVVMTIYGEVSLLAFGRLGSEEWIDVPSPSKSFSDIVYYKGRFYAVDCHGVAFICDIDDDQSPKATAIARAPKGTEDWIKKYLVESSGQLLLVSRIFGGRYFTQDYVEDYSGHEDSDYETEDDYESEEEIMVDDEPYVTVGFIVMKLVERSRKNSKYKFEWVKIDSLGDQALFVGDNASISLPASNFNGYKSNCIYFTDDFELYESSTNGGGHDMGVFSMGDGTIKPHYTGKSLSYFSTPLWYV